MKSFVKGVLILITLAVVSAVIYLVFLYPNHKYSLNNLGSDPVSLQSFLTKKLPKNFSLKNKKIQTEIEISEEDLENLIMSNVNKDERIQAIDVVIENNSLRIFISQKMMKYIPVEASLLFKPGIEDDKAKLVLEESKFGRFKLSKKKVLEKMMNADVRFFQARPLEGDIILEDSELKDTLRVTNINFKDKKVFLGIELEVTSIEDFMKVIDMFTKK